MHTAPPVGPATLIVDFDSSISLEIVKMLVNSLDDENREQATLAPGRTELPYELTKITYHCAGDGPANPASGLYFYCDNEDDVWLFCSTIHLGYSSQDPTEYGRTLTRACANAAELLTRLGLHSELIERAENYMFSCYTGEVSFISALGSWDMRVPARKY